MLINLFATVVLLLYMQTLGHLAGLAAAPTWTIESEQLRSPSPILHTGGALLLLVVALTLAVYKPRGITAYGHRKQQEQRVIRSQPSTTAQNR